MISVAEKCTDDFENREPSIYYVGGVVNFSSILRDVINLWYGGPLDSSIYTRFLIKNVGLGLALQFLKIFPYRGL